MNRKEIEARNNVTIHGEGEKTVMLAHGFGCDQRMWRFVLPELVKKYRVVLFDYVGSGKSKLSAFSTEKYSSLDGYASDVLEIIDAIDAKNLTFIGHSVSSMIGVLAAAKNPEAFSKMVMVCPSPCFLNDPPDYNGGFEEADLKELIDLMDKNYIGWADYLAPMVMGASAPPELTGELSGSFCSTDPVVAKTFAKATFFSDHREHLPRCHTKTLIIQSASDALAAVEIGEYINKSMPDSVMEVVQSQGHCLHMTEPEATVRLIGEFLAP